GSRPWRPRFRGRASSARQLGDADLGKPFFVGREHPQVDGHTLEQPPAALAPITVVVAGRHPQAAVPAREDDRLPEVPAAGRAVAVDAEDGVRDLMDRERDDLRTLLEELANRLASSEATEDTPVPHRVLGEERREEGGVVAVVAIGAVTVLEIANRLEVLEAPDPSLEIAVTHDVLL